MSFPSILVIAVSLGMDAFSVAIGVGAVSQSFSLGPAMRLSSSFGMFQFLMPVAGWFAGMTVAHMIAGYDYWVAFGLLAYVGGKMVMDSFHEKENSRETDPTKGWTLIILSVATSIDAFAVGLSFAFLQIPIIYPSIIIGVVAFIMTMIGMLFGGRLGKVIGKKAELAGGIILIGIGVKILIEHMT